jgi:hypothetical protein
VSLTASTENILNVYRNATVQDIVDGTEWYARARRLAMDLDPVDPVRGAAAIALVSPMTPWDRNVWLAGEAYRMHAAGIDVATMLPTLKGNARKVARVLNGENPANVVGGLKVTAFWLTIADPTNPSAVVIDRHAYDIAVGETTNDEIRGKAIGTPKRYAALAELYVEAADILSKESGQTILPSTVQAITWTAWRRSMIRIAAAVRRAEGITDHTAVS